MAFSGCSRKAFLLILTLGMSLSASADSPPYAPHVAQEILIRFQPRAGPSDRANIRAQLNAQRVRSFHSGAEHWRLGPGRTTEKAIARLRGNPHVKYIEPNYLIRLDLAPNDPRYPELYGLNNTGQTGGAPGADIDAERAWNVSTGSHRVQVAVIDSGIDSAHPDLAANLWSNPGEVPGNGTDDDGNGFIDDIRGWDFFNGDPDPFDDNGHGTHVAGTIGAVGNNGVGITGVNWQVTLVPLKILGADGFGDTASAVAAIEYGTRLGVDIMNASWGGPGFSQTLRDAIQSAADSEILFVAAAGNNGLDNDASPHYPSSYEIINVVAVAATDANDNLAFFSNFGATSVDLGAPGVAILSTLPGNFYGRLNGTSMATPHVAGAAALVRAIAPTVRAGELKSILLEAAEALPSLSGTCLTGGRLNAFLAIAEPDTEPPGAVEDLTAAEVTSNSVFLRWTATGDDGDLGTASSYDIRFSNEPVTESSFDSSPRSAAPFRPGPAGASEEWEVVGLTCDTTYYFALKAVDEWGNAGPLSNLASSRTLPAPTLASWPTSFEATLLTGESTTRTMTIQNIGVGTLDWHLPLPRVGESSETGAEPLAGASEDGHPQETVPVANRFGGPDEFGYRFIDSDEPGGPDFIWTDLALEGTPIEELSGDGEVSSPLPLGFGFFFYGRIFTSVRVSTDGWLSFSDSLPHPLNRSLPSGEAPPYLIAPFWDDLDFEGAVRAHYVGEEDRFTVQFTDVPRASGPGHYTFQVTLLASGEILFRYLSMTGTVTSATVGIQDGGQEVGLEVVFEAPYLRDHQAVRITPLPQWLSVTPTQGRLCAGEGGDVTLTLNAADLISGGYGGTVFLHSNDPQRLETQHPVTLWVQGIPDLSVQGDGITLESRLGYHSSGALTIHALPIAVPPAGEGELEIVIDGDYDAAHETAKVTVEGHRLGTLGGTRTLCTRASAVFPLAPDLLTDLVADGIVQVEVRNSDTVDFFCPLNQHTVRLHYTGSAQLLDFGPVQVGLGRQLSLHLQNDGTDTLQIEIETDEKEEFVPSRQKVSLPARSSTSLGVSFLPSESRDFAGILTLQSNDPDTPLITVALAGTGTPPPPFPRSVGFWKHQCSDLGFRQVSLEELGQLFFEVSLVSDAFPECATLGCDAFQFDGPKNLMRPKAEREALALRLNLASGRVNQNSPVSLPDLTSATTVGEAVAEIEATLCNPLADRADLGAAKDIAEALNLGGEDMELASLDSALWVTPGTHRPLILGLINMSPTSGSYELSASGPWPLRLSSPRVDGLGSGELALVTVEVTVPWGVEGDSVSIRVQARDRLSEAPLHREAIITLSVSGTDSGDGRLRVRAVD